LQEKKNEISINIKEIEEKLHLKTKTLDEYRANRNKCQQNVQHIQALKGRIHIAEDRLRQLEIGRMNIDDIKATYTNEIKVCFLTMYMLFFKNCPIKSAFN